MTTTIAQIDAWRAVLSENAKLEFKAATKEFDFKKLCKYCVALANEGGGNLLLGIRDRPPRKVIGTMSYRNPAKAETDLFQKLNFRVDIESVSHPGGRVVIFHIPSRPSGTAYAFEGAYWMRSGESLVPMSEDRLRKIFSESQPDWLSHAAKTDCDAGAVIELLDTQSYFDLSGAHYPTKRAGVLERLENEGIIKRKGKGWLITNFGAILFAKQLDHFGNLAYKAPRIIVYDGKGKIKTKADKSHNTGYINGFESLFGIINNLIPSNEVIKQALRREVKMFPPLAVRELIANALIHQDFNETGGAVMIEFYDDRMEISNPGEPPIPPDRFIDVYKSRNERLANIMRRFGICEEQGSGVDKVISDVETFQLPAPDFRVAHQRTSVVLFAPQHLKQMNQKDRIRACYQHCCLRYVMNDQMTNSSLRDRFKLSKNKTTTASTIIKATMKDKRIKLANPEQQSNRYRKYVPFWA